MSGFPCVGRSHRLSQCREPRKPCRTAAICPQMDLILSPVAMGPGISVKTAQAMVLGDAANRSAFCRVLDAAGALALDMHLAWRLAAEPAPLPGLAPQSPTHPQRPSATP